MASVVQTNQEYSPFQAETFKAAAAGVFGLSKNFSEEEIEEAKELGFYIADSRTITWGGLHKFGSFADMLNHIALSLQPVSA